MFTNVVKTIAQIHYLCIVYGMFSGISSNVLFIYFMFQNIQISNIP